MVEILHMAIRHPNMATPQEARPSTVVNHKYGICTFCSAKNLLLEFK
jgi:hypothetical protein